MPTPNVPTTPEEWEAAITAAGSSDRLGEQLGISGTTVRKRARAAGASTKSGKAPNAGVLTPAIVTLSKFTDEELSTLVGTFGTDRCCIVLGTTANTLRLYLKKRGVVPAHQSTSPALGMLAQRVRRLEKDDAAIRELAKAIEESAKLGAPPAPIKRQPAPAPLKKRTPVDVILHVSDIQYGEVVHGEEVPGGGYSPDIFAEQRLPRYVHAVEAILRTVAQTNPIGTVWVAQGGDFVEGEGVFAGQHWHLAMDAGRQVDTLGGLWSQAVSQIASDAKNLNAERVVCLGVVGNHGVHGGRKAGAVPASLSYDWLTYRSAALRLEGMRDGAVDWIDPEPRKAVYFEAAGNVVLMTHGDQDKGGGLIGVPVVTGMRNDMTVRLQTGIDHRYHLCGHFHRKTSITVGGTRMKLWNQDWCGANNLSVGRGGGGHPSQMVYVMHPEHGLHSSYIVNLADLDHDISHEIVR